MQALRTGQCSGIGDDHHPGPTQANFFWGGRREEEREGRSEPREKVGWAGLEREEQMQTMRDRRSIGALSLAQRRMQVPHSFSRPQTFFSRARWNGRRCSLFPWPSSQREDAFRIALHRLFAKNRTLSLFRLSFSVLTAASLLPRASCDSSSSTGTD